MRKSIQVVAIALLVLLVWSAGVVVLFQRVYAGHIGLRRLGRGTGGADGRTLSAIHRDAVGGRLTRDDTLTAIQAMVLNQRPDQALTALADLVRRHPGNVQYRLLYADWLCAEKRHEEAKTQYLACQERVADTPGARAGREHMALRLAENAWAAGWTDKAMARYAALLKDRPDSAKVRAVYAEVLAKSGRPEAAMTQYEMLLQGAPGNVDFRIRLARAAVSAGRLADAIRQCNEVAQLRPGDRDALVLRAECELALGGSVTRRGQLEALAGRRRDDLGVTRILARAYLRDGEFHPAAILFRKLKPETMAEMTVSQGYAEALAGYGRATPTDKSNLASMASMVATWKPAERPAALLAALAKAFVALGEKGRGVWFLEQAVQRSPRDRGLRAELVRLLQELGRHQEATQHYEVLTKPAKE